MSLEGELCFDISRCSLCALGRRGGFCAPSISTHQEILLVLPSPDGRACQNENGWASTSARLLERALGHASGAGMSRYHLSYLSKCKLTPHENGKEPSKLEKLRWAETCASNYLQREIEGGSFKKIILFGEISWRVLFPNLKGSFSEYLHQPLTLSPYEIPTHIFEGPASLHPQGGLGSLAGRDFVLRLHQILGGMLHLPNLKVEKNLFELFE